MPATQAESHQISVLAGQGETTKLATLVREIADRDSASPGEILMGCKDDFQQTAAHIAAAAGQTRGRPGKALPFSSQGINADKQAPSRP